LTKAHAPPISVNEKEWSFMARVEIYTKAFCGYCARAKALLERKGVAFEEYDITMGGPRRSEMLDRSRGGSTVPQIFINGAHIGGSDDMGALERAGKLDGMLGL
jgi:glutaredoxin 3